jgi:hypothetical protein
VLSGISAAILLVLVTGVIFKPDFGFSLGPVAVWKCSGKVSQQNGIPLPQGITVTNLNTICMCGEVSGHLYSLRFRFSGDDSAYSLITHFGHDHYAGPGEK